jgi:hypothetical protein
MTKEIKSTEAFIYLWYYAPNKKFYLGKHKGSPDDSYTHSSTVWEHFTKDNIPKGAKRRILAYGTDEEMCILEHKLLVNRKNRCWDRYYNESLGDPRYVDTSGENHYYYGKKRPEISGENHHFYGIAKEDHPLYGRPRLEETKKKLSIANTGKTHTEETKEKLKIIRANQLHDKEYLEKWEEAVKAAGLLRRGENNHMYGKTLTEETKNKISNNRKGKCVGKDNHNYGKSGSEIPSYKHGKLVNARNDPEVRRAYKAEWYQRKKAEKQGSVTLEGLFG